MVISTGWEYNEDIVGEKTEHSEQPKPDINTEPPSLIADIDKGNGNIHVIVTEDMFQYYRAGLDINTVITVHKKNLPPNPHTIISIDEWKRIVYGVGRNAVIACLALMMECLDWARDDILILLHAANDGRWNLFSMWLDNATLTEMQEHKRL